MGSPHRRKSDGHTKGFLAAIPVTQDVPGRQLLRRVILIQADIGSGTTVQLVGSQAEVQKV